MNRTSEIAFDHAGIGHCLIEPIQWYGRLVSQLFTKPLQEEPFFAAIEVVVRIVAFVVLALICPVVLLATSAALVGWVITSCSPPLKAESDILANSALKLPSADAAEASQASAPASFFVPAPPEIVTVAREKSTELVTYYNGLRELSEKNILKLLSEITDFRFQYEIYRDPDPSNIDEMTKIFISVDALASNTLCLQHAFQQWANFYRVQADEQGVIQQPKDGNCWLHTSIQGLKHINHPNLGEDTYLTLRPKVVDWMRSHYDSDENLRRFVADAIEAHKAVEADRLREDRDSLRCALKENLIPPRERPQARAAIKNYEKSLRDLEGFSLKDYFKHMEKLGSHGTHAELYAISRMFQVNIAIWRDIAAHGNVPSGLTIEFDEQILNPHAVNTVNAVLTQQGNHFNYRLPPAIES